MLSMPLLLLTRRLLLGWLIPGTLILGPACSREQDQVTPVADQATPPAFAVSTDYLQLQQESLDTLTLQLPEQAVTKARQLQTSAERLLQEPTSERLRQTRQDWQTALEAYEDFYIFTRLGLISPQNFQALTELDYRLAAWPIQPGYLDRFGPYTAVGLVFDIGLPLNEENLRKQHGLMDESDIALGFYALEFVLFGERGTRAPETLRAIDTLNADQRHAGYQSADELPENRRRQLITLQIQLIVSDIQHLQAQWQPGRNKNAATQFASLSSEQRVVAILRAGLAMLTEQIITLTEQSRTSPDAPEESYPQDQQLAQRLIRQLNGWNLVLQQIDMQSRTKLVQLTQACLDELQDILDQPLTSEGEDNTPVIDWRDTYSALSALANAVRNLTQGV